MTTYIGHINASKLFIETDNEGLIQTLYEKLRYEEPEFSPNKFSKWNGVVRLFNKRDGSFPYGLLSDVIKEVIAYNLPYEIDPFLKTTIRDITRADIQEWVDGLDIRNEVGDKITPYDYQVEGLYLSIRYSRYVALAATSAGKSLLQYLLVRFWQEMMGDEASILIVVPTIQLTQQMYEDFGVYSAQDNWDVSNNVHVAGDGVSPYTRKKVVVCTWQTLIKQDDEFFHRFNFLSGDEAHTFSSDSLKHISNNCINAYQRIGLTGTLKKDPSHVIRVVQHFGNTKRLVRTKELQDRGLASKTNIFLVKLNHTYETREILYKDRRVENEIQVMMASEARNNFIINTAKVLKGNSLFMFHRVDDHMLKVFDELKASGINKPCYIIHGGVSAQERQEIKQHLERGDDIILFATYGTTSTGISIKKLHNLVLCYPTKSLIRVLQTIGRMLRLHDTKDVANIYDLIDVANFRGRNNRMMDWANERFGMYTDEEHPMKLVNINL